MNLPNKLEMLVYGYEPNKFLPIRRNGKLSNKGAYLKYKLGYLLQR